MSNQELIEELKRRLEYLCERNEKLEVENVGLRNEIGKLQWKIIEMTEVPSKLGEHGA